ncbi:Hok/Gef family protein [Escherichia coli]|nr:Hok/Gef family protein [Escherichia coli]EFN8388088.1 Hok/Gef family protein [Escherichia coli]
MNNIRIASYRALRKEKKAMKQPKNALTWCLLIVCCTLLIFTYLTRNRLCEVRLFGDDVVLALSAFTKGVFCTDTPFFHVFSGY